MTSEQRHMLAVCVDNLSAFEDREKILINSISRTVERYGSPTQTQEQILDELYYSLLERKVLKLGS